MNSSELRSQISEEFFYDKGVNIAKELIGKFLIKENTGCGSIIVKTEAYLGENDPSCHFAKNSEHRKKFSERESEQFMRTKFMVIICMNIISEYKGNPEGTLIRAIKPSRELKKGGNGATGIIKQSLASGPGKLTEALGITKEENNGEKLSESPIAIYETDQETEIEVSSRIGISKSKDCVRFSVKDSNYVSKPVRHPDTSFSLDGYYQKFE